MPVIPLIIQARMSSTRLPGKVMMPFLGKTFLESCVDRAARIHGISDVIVATTDEADSDPIANLMKRRDYRVFRGSRDDVLGRYLGAAREVKADAVMRITSDCPLTDPAIAETILAQFSEGRTDLMTTNIPPSWPNGMDVEVFTMDALEEAARCGTIRSDREHVSTYIRRRPGRFRLGNIPCPDEGCGHWRMTLDTAADRDFFLMVAKEFPGDLSTSHWPKLHEFLESRPDLIAINTDEDFSLTCAS
ncbi:cytidylyltransferase domain-containing protein [Palleronia caenipelagi]|uniref:Acylneuraminate cytidylyltransferase n=1 Tax=Palleronia caenipelagi TaxID=2489174 RepID=A0A547PLD2_9RHOB|nr:glycosyltransferase family protein [Palleronia caenipelagi]TRD14952.1 acylneuraminate cytidylyltransferase [Palleronia caenipelagi]